jgi:two-component system response regulator MprA
MGEGTRKGRVLVVDDDPDIIDFLEMALEDAGYLVLASVDGESLQVAHDTQPDVILLDINMPGMNGVEVSQRLRDDPVTADIPIVVMSAQDRLRTTGALMPVNDRLPKPFDLAGLYAVVGRWVVAA